VIEALGGWRKFYAIPVEENLGRGQPQLKPRLLQSSYTNI
jgi:hypothetical protein